MNHWPVVSITMKGVEGLNFRDAFGMLEVLIANTCKKYVFLAESSAVNSADRELFSNLMFRKADRETVKDSLVLFTRMMAAHYGKPAILLVDEYDVPLAKASERGYYTEMTDVVRALLGGALKTNPYLNFAVVTGCLRISKESIFTGVNNFVTDTITGDRFNEYIGFTTGEVEKILEDYDFTSHAGDMKRWYDGYRFGQIGVYCPWDVLNYINALCWNPNAKPGNYWGNTSHNAIIRQFIERRDLREREYINADFERLIAGEAIWKTIREDLTYDTVHSSSENIWSLLLLSGYLTIDPSARIAEDAVSYGGEGRRAALRIPNEEVRYLFRTTVQEWFMEKVRSEERTELFRALWSRDGKSCSEQISRMVYDTISCYDYREDFHGVEATTKDSAGQNPSVCFYRAFMAGILSYAGYGLLTNKEAGEGRPDIVLKDERNDRAMVMELKWTPDKKQMEAKCEEALLQIRDRRYAEGLEVEFSEVLCCGICFFKKQCLVRFES